MVHGVLFDKDGTLFDFGRSWSAWAHGVIRDLADDTQATAGELASLLSYDLENRRFFPDSIAIAGTLSEVVEVLAPALPTIAPPALEQRLAARAAATAMVPVLPLGPLLQGLRDSGLTLGVATNDAEGAARAHLQNAEILDKFQFIFGYDSGHGGKPEPGMCLAFARSAGLPPEACVMVGDSTHDLIAGRAAGMRTVAVLTGLATADVLAPLADAVLPDIGALPGWLAAQA
ncbi:HAD-IA family hydrolase [Rhodobacterales bacterium HKCCSP123]|nr:HAD-IA family hydrolase [Rhodobacterales bacterium HKCCSP123]